MVEDGSRIGILKREKRMLWSNIEGGGRWESNRDIEEGGKGAMK